MKGLPQIPQQEDLEKAYARIQGGARLSEKECSDLSQWGRFDPRLAEQLVSALVRDWKSLAPVILNEEMRKRPWPAALGVLTEMVRFHPLWVKADGNQYGHWNECVMMSIEPANHESYFIGTRAFAGKLVLEDAAASITPYRTWGYLGRDVLVNKAVSKGTLLSREARYGVVEALLREKKKFTVADYLERLGGQVDRRQAQRDLECDPRVKRTGNTRGRFYS